MPGVVFSTARWHPQPEKFDVLLHCKRDNLAKGHLLIINVIYWRTGKSYIYYMILKKSGEPQCYEDLIIKLQEVFDGVVKLGRENDIILELNTKIEQIWRQIYVQRC